jgi:hypothetical protein
MHGVRTYWNLLSSGWGCDTYLATFGHCAPKGPGYLFGGYTLKGHGLAPLSWDNSVEPPVLRPIPLIAGFDLNLERSSPGLHLISWIPPDFLFYFFSLNFSKHYLKL